MTTLIGIDSATGFDQAHGYDLANQYFYEPFVCAVSGAPSAIYLYSDAHFTANKWKLAIWDASGTKLGETAELDGPTSAGFAGGAITTASPLESGQTYYLGFIIATNFAFFTDSNVNEIGNDTGSYPTVPDVDAPITTTSGWGHIAVYVDGVAGGADTLMAQAIF